MFHVEHLTKRSTWNTQKSKHIKHSKMNTNPNTVEETAQAVEMVETMEGNTIPREEAAWCDHYCEYTENPTWPVYSAHGSLTEPVN